MYIYVTRGSLNESIDYQYFIQIEEIKFQDSINEYELWTIYKWLTQRKIKQKICWQFLNFSSTFEK